MQHQIPFKYIFWSNYHLTNRYLSRKNFLNFIRVFPFFHFIFLLKWNKQEIFKSKHQKHQKQSSQPLTLLKKTLLQVFSYEFCEISKNTFSNRTPPVVASERWKIGKPITLQRTFFTQVTGNRVSDHYARNVYIKVFL